MTPVNDATDDDDATGIVRVAPSPFFIFRASSMCGARESDQECNI